MKNIVGVMVLILISCVNSYAGDFILGGVIGGSLNTASSGAYNGIEYGSRSNWSPRFGAEATYNLVPPIELGVFYDHNLLFDNPDGTMSHVWFTGAIGRLEMPWTEHLFIDVKLGASRTQATRYTTNVSFGYGLALGYELKFLPIVSFMPRIAFRDLGSGNVPGTGLSLGSGFFDLDLVVRFRF
jgi:hypothetical protein